MKIEKNLLPNSVVELIVEEETQNVAKYRSLALKHLEKNADIKGFRKGAKIPEGVLVRKFGEEYVGRLTIDFAIDAIYRESLRSEGVVPVAQGEIKEIISESPLKLKIHIEVLPNVEIDPKYKDIKLKKQMIEVSDDEVKKALEDIETRFTKFEEVSDAGYKSQMGDRVTINTQGYENEKELDNTNMLEYPIVLGSNILVPGFEEQIVGAKTGDKLEFPVDFPADYHNAEFASKKTIFKVEVTKIEKAVKPEFTEEFIEQLRGKKLDLEGFKELVKEEIRDTKESNARMDEESRLMEELMKISKLEIGEKLLQHNIEKVFNEIKENITKDGLRVADYLESLKMDEETYKEKNVKPVAEKRLQGELILHKLDELEPVEITEEEMNKEVQNILARFGSADVLSRLKELYMPNSKYYEELKQRIRYRKLIDTFFEM
ncbi:MAG: trigger factor [Candidatus Gracilibacteria bacterium]|nr:trigger factor [Candidatus Gracilibacteria bacterium]